MKWSLKTKTTSAGRGLNARHIDSNKTPAVHITSGSQSVSPLWRDKERVDHLGNGFSLLLQALHFAQTRSSVFSDKDRQELTYNYFPRVKDALQQGGLAGAVFADLEFVRQRLELGSLMTKEEAALAIKSIILGYTLFLAANFSLEFDWVDAKKQMERQTDEIQEPPGEEAHSKQASNEPELLPPPQTIEKREGQQRKKVKKSGKEPLLKKELEDFAKNTGGRFQGRPSQGVVPAIRSRLLLPEKKDHYQILILVDASDSMDDDIHAIRENVVSIINLAERQLKRGGQVSLAIRYYVDEVVDRRGSIVPLDSAGALASREKLERVPNHKAEIEEAKGGLTRLLGIIDKNGGSLEYHWEASMNAMHEEPWEPKEGVEKVIFLITDEDDGGGINIRKFHREDVEKEAQKRGIRFEPIQLPPSLGLGGGGCFTGNAYLKQEGNLLITFSELSEKFKNGEKLPRVASFDEATRSIIYQEPTNVIDHGIMESAMLYLDLDYGGRAATLEVTPNHRLLILRNRGKSWLPAGELKPDDLLINPDGGLYTLTSLRAVEGAWHLYNLSFSSPQKWLHPTFLISGDGIFWLAAHNIKI